MVRGGWQHRSCHGAAHLLPVRASGSTASGARATGGRGPLPGSGGGAAACAGREAERAQADLVHVWEEPLGEQSERTVFISNTSLMPVTETARDRLAVWFGWRP